ncbi:MAG: phosphate ABC transporter permease PstA [Rickettsiales bacterium]|nr:phosphate ABC transporter permease PstA [Rickettsiales bacterium]
MTSAHFKKRQRAAWRFKLYGQLAIGFACLALFVLLGNIVMRGYTGFIETQIYLPKAEGMKQAITAMPGVLVIEDDEGVAEVAPVVASGVSAITLIEPEEVVDPAVVLAKQQKQNYKLAKKLFSGAIRRQIKNTSWITAATNVDIWNKGILSEEQMLADGRFNEQQLGWLKEWKEQGHIRKTFDIDFLTSGDSREPEQAGFAASIIGSLLTVLICLSVAFPMGVMTAVYLEEFAPKNKISDLIEVNINNLAAVPSIVFGLLGLGLYLNLFGMPRSASLVGGLTLAMLVLPVIIIATRAALRAVPPSIRDAARGLGATELQVVAHHVLPLSLPGIMTGTILGVARAIGETAPLLMIGMVAFIADVPEGFTDPASAMPVQVFLWASSPELGFVEKTSAGIMVLLTVLLMLNFVAIMVRNRFETKW